MDHHPIAPRRTLRKDPRGWQIDDDPTAERVLQSLEILGLIFAETLLKRLSHLHLDPADDDLDLALRGLGHVSGSVAMSRLAWMTGVDEAGKPRRDKAGEVEAEDVGDAMRRVLDWLFEWDLNNPAAPPRFRAPTAPPATVRIDLNELWSAALYFDRRARNQGTTGPGRRRDIVRSTTRKASS